MAQENKLIDSLSKEIETQTNNLMTSLGCEPLRPRELEATAYQYLILSTRQT